MPLAYITQEVIIQQDHLNGSLLFHNGSHLLNVHLQTTITHKYTYSAVGTSESCTDCCGKSEAHCTQPTGSYNATFLTILKVTGRHHLILTNISNQYSFMIRCLTYGTDHFSHTQRFTCRMQLRTDHLFFLYFLVRQETIQPFLVSSRFQKCRNGSKGFLAIAQYGNICLHILVYLSRIYIEMNDFRLFGIRIQLSGYTVVKAHTYGDKYIALIRIDIRSQVTVHPQHTFI